jgi:hypothetical protein
MWVIFFWYFILVSAIFNFGLKLPLSSSPGSVFIGGEQAVNGLLFCIMINSNRYTKPENPIKEMQVKYERHKSALINWIISKIGRHSNF